MSHRTRSKSGASTPNKDEKDEQPTDLPSNAEGESSVPSSTEPMSQEMHQGQQKQSPRSDSTPENGKKSSNPASQSNSPSKAWEERSSERGRAGQREASHAPLSPTQFQRGAAPQAAASERFSQDHHHPMEQVDPRYYDQIDLEEDQFILQSFSGESPSKPQVDGLSPSAERETSSLQPHSSSGRSRRSPPPHPYAYHQHSYTREPSYRRSSTDSYQHHTPGSSRGFPPGYYRGYHPLPSPAAYRESGVSGHRLSPRYSYSAYAQYPPPDSYWEGHYPNPYLEHDDDIPPPPPSTTKKRPSELPAASPMGTPENLKLRSPFRSPPATKHNFKRSPDFQASPNFSFGIDTPKATFGPSTFSPLESQYEEFNEERTTLTFGGVDLAIGGSDSQESPVTRRRLKEEPSPLTGFMSGLSPMGDLRDIRSPMVPGYEPPSSHERPKPVTASGSRGEQRNLSTPHSSVKKALWPGPEGNTPGRVRMEIGSTGALSTRKHLDGISNMIHPRSSCSTPSRQDLYRGHQHRAPPTMHTFRSDLTTPIKPSGYHSRTSPGNMPRPYSGSASKFPTSASKPRFAPSSNITPSADKENKKKAATPKRTPCNCKKSKCLKLYCECFANELFCQGCNCSDCHNTPSHRDARDKAIKETRAKNPNAFKNRFGTTQNAPQGASPQAVHNMGCRCKKSECLKKYCECFQAGVICGEKCKCSGCQNFAGSQALIDKRRKIKDQRGADVAMRLADEAWKNSRPGGSARKPVTPAVAGSSAPDSASAPRRPPPSKTPSMGRMPPPAHMMHPSSRGPPPGHPHHPHHPYHALPPYMHGPPPHGYPPMGMHMPPPGYPHHPHAPRPDEMHHGMYPPHMLPPPPTHRDLKRPAPASSAKPTRVALGKSTPRTPGVRVEFDPVSSRKKRKISGQEEPTIAFFGQKVAPQPKTTALSVFSFLSNDDLYNAGLVCKSWSQLAMDHELWKFD